MNSLSLKVNGEYLDLYRDTEINFNIKNQVFYRDVIPGNVVYSINLPATPNNKRVLGFTNHIDVSTDIATYSATLYVNGSTFLEGNFKVKTVKNNEFRGALQSGIAALEQLKEYSLRDFDYGSRTFDKNSFRAYAFISWEVQSGETAAIKLNGTVFSAAYNNSTLQTIKDLASKIKNGQSDIAVKAMEDNYVDDTGQQQTEHLLTLEDKRMDTVLDFDLSISQNTAKLHSIRAHYDQNNKPHFYRKAFADQLDNDIDKLYPDRKVFFPLIKNKDTYYNSHGYPDTYARPGYRRPSEDDHLEGLVFGGTEYYLPQVSVLHIIKTIFNQFGYTVEGSFFEDGEIKGLFLFNNYQQPISNELNYNNLTINYNDYLPDAKANSFIKNVLLKVFNASIEIDNINKKATIRFMNEIINTSKYLDLSSKVTYAYTINRNENTPYAYELAEPDDKIWENIYVGRDNLDNHSKGTPVNDKDDLPSSVTNGMVIFVSNENLYYIGTNNKWEPFTYFYYRYNPEQHDDPEDISTEVSPLAMLKEEKGINGIKQLIPHTDIELNGPKINSGISDSSLRLAFYRGAQESNIVDYKYPFASSDAYTVEGGAKYNYAIRYEGAKGLYENFWEDYDKFRQNLKEVDRSFKFSIADIIQLTEDTKILENGRYYFWKELSGTISAQSGLSIVDVKLLKENI